MERSGFVRHGVLRLPPGFRFHPTDEELVVQYLRRKALSYPLPAAVIPEINLGKFDPWDLPGESEGERYFFNLREAAAYPNGGRGGSRATRSGYWKASGKDKPVVAYGINEVVGMKKVLEFHRWGKPPHGTRTDWIMHEYCLAKGCSSEAKDWVVCRIFKKRAKKLNHDGFERSPSSNASSSSSSSSCVTSLTEVEKEDQEEGDEGSSKSLASPSHGRVL